MSTSEKAITLTEEQLTSLVTSIFTSVNSRIADRIIQTVSGGDTSHTVSAEALEKYLKNMELSMGSSYNSELTETLKNYVKHTDIQDVVRTSNLTTTLADYVTLTVLQNMLKDYATNASLEDVVRTGDLGDSTDLAEVLSEYVKTTNMNTELAKKQNKLTGSAGQVVGFDSTGNAIAQELGSTKPGYLHTFTASNWVKGSQVQAKDENHSEALYDYTITIAANVHGLTGTSVTANFLCNVNGTYQPNTWACIDSYATIASNVITLHYISTESSTGYDGKVMLFVM